MNIGTLIATLGVNTTGLIAAEAAMKKFEARTTASITSINAKLVTTGTAMKKFGRGMTMGLTVPIALAGGAAFKLYKDFEFSLAKVTGLVGIAKSQVDEWGQEILKMAPRLAKAPKELADALFFITSAGIRGAEAMEVLEMSAKASTAGLGETKVVADLVTSAMNAYGKETLTASMATDILTAAVREGKAEADALASSMGMVLPLASEMGVSFDQVAAAVAAMTRTGTSAQTASMQLRQMLAALVKPSQQAEMALWGMGTSAANLRKTIREDGLLDALMEVKDLSAKYGEEVMSKVFPNIRALSGVLDIMGANLESNIKIFKSLEEALGSLDGAYKAATDTVEFKWNQAIVSAQTTLTVLGKTISESIIPILERFTARMQKIAMWFYNLDDAQKRSIIRIGALVAAIGPLSIALGWLVGNVLPGLLILLLRTTKAIRALTMVMARNPAILLGIAIAAVVLRMIDFEKWAKKATEAQNNFNDSLLEGAELQGQAQSIEEQMRVLKTLNKRQVANLMTRITTQIKLERDYSTVLLAEAVKRLEADKQLKRLTEQLNAAEDIKIQLGIKAKIYRRRLELTEGLEMENEASQKRLAILTTYYYEAVKKAKEFNKATQAAVTNIAYDTALKELVVQTEFAVAMQKALGDQFDYTAFMINATRTTLEALLRIDMDPLNKEVIKLATNLTALEASLDVDAIAKQMTKFGTELELFAKYGALMGSAFDSMKAHIELFETTIDVLLRRGIDPMNEDIVELNRQLQELIAMQALAAGSVEDLKDTFVNAAAGPALVASAFMGMSNSISDALNSTEGILKSFGKFFGDFIKGMIMRLVAATIAAFALAIVLQMIPGMQVKIFKGLDKAASFKDIFGAGFKSFAGIGMAGGGTVPAGFSGDSYPAMLTSGKTVTPPGQLQRQTVSVKVEDILLEGDMLRIQLGRATTQHEAIT